MVSVSVNSAFKWLDTTSLLATVFWLLITSDLASVVCSPSQMACRSISCFIGGFTKS